MSRRTARLSLLAIFALFAVPLVVAVLMHTGHIEWRPGGMRNAGLLVDPPLALDGFTARTPPRWNLLYVPEQPCDAACVQRQEALERVHAATGRHQERVAVITLDTKHEGAHGALDAQARSLGGDSAAGWTWLLDPGGRVVLAYNPQAEATGILKDLKRLLTWSKQDESR
ncbi:MAG: hypothetical protein R3233_09665 [Xanthomonadales bacterium]|nr:hypothetical protein [Xanthomonadales bacterium]